MADESVRTPSRTGATGAVADLQWRIFPGMPVMSLDPATRARIQSLLDSSRVVLFMKGVPQAPQCGFSA